MSGETSGEKGWKRVNVSQARCYAKAVQVDCLLKYQSTADT